MRRRRGRGPPLVISRGSEVTRPDLARVDETEGPTAALHGRRRDLKADSPSRRGGAGTGARCSLATSRAPASHARISGVHPLTQRASTRAPASSSIRTSAALPDWRRDGTAYSCPRCTAWGRVRLPFHLRPHLRASLSRESTLGAWAARRELRWARAVAGRSLHWGVDELGLGVDGA